MEVPCVVVVDGWWRVLPFNRYASVSVDSRVHYGVGLLVVFLWQGSESRPGGVKDLTRYNRIFMLGRGFGRPTVVRTDINFFISFHLSIGAGKFCLYSVPICTSEQMLVRYHFNLDISIG